MCPSFPCSFPHLYTLDTSLLDISILGTSILGISILSISILGLYMYIYIHFNFKYLSHFNLRMVNQISTWNWVVPVGTGQILTGSAQIPIGIGQNHLESDWFWLVPLSTCGAQKSTATWDQVQIWFCFFCTHYIHAGWVTQPVRLCFFYFCFPFVLQACWHSGGHLVIVSFGQSHHFCCLDKMVAQNTR